MNFGMRRSRDRTTTVIDSVGLCGTSQVARASHASKRVETSQTVHRHPPPHVRAIALGSRGLACSMKFDGPPNKKNNTPGTSGKR